MIHTVEIQFEVFYIGPKPVDCPPGIPLRFWATAASKIENPEGWYYWRSGDGPIGPYAGEAMAVLEAEAELKSGQDYYTNAAYLARQRHQRNEDHIPDPKAGE